MTTPTTTLLNDVDIASVASLATKIGEDPGAAATTWKATVDWQQGFRSAASIRDFAPLQSDEPAALGGSDTGPNPVEQLLSALGNCLAVGYAANATAAGIEIEDLRIELEGDLDLHTFLGLNPDGNAGFHDIRVAVDLRSPASEAEIQALHERVVATSPVGHTLSRAVNVDVQLS